MKTSALLSRPRTLVGCPSRRPVSRPQGAAAQRSMRLRVASVDQQTSASQLPSEDGAGGVQPAPSSLLEIDQAESVELELEELDQAQEQMIKWMALSEEEQEVDLDEMVDYDEFGDEEYEEELFDEVERLVDATCVELKVGDRVIGTVYEIDEDGAYVEIGQKCSGFVPLSECSFARLKTPLEVLRVGMKREFMVVEDEDDYDQVILSLAATEATVFWQRMRQMQEESLTVNVKVESANRGGLLVRYGPYEGFMPVSQFGPQINPETMDSLVGGELPVKFLEVDEDMERLVFSNKRVTAASSVDMQGIKMGDVLTGVVQYLRPYGAFLDLGNGAVGLLHVSQISHERVVSVDKILREGDKLKVMVLSMDPTRGRVTLSTKKLEPTPGDMLRDPQLVYDKAEEMAETFRKRVEAAEMNALAVQDSTYAATSPYGAADQGGDLSS